MALTKQSDTLRRIVVEGEREERQGRAVISEFLEARANHQRVPVNKFPNLLETASHHQRSTGRHHRTFFAPNVDAISPAYLPQDCEMKLHWR
jgi:hypothetical protein